MLEKKIFRIENKKVKGINPLASAYKDYDVIGLDTETVKGELYSYQLYSKDLGISEFFLHNGENDVEIVERIIERCNLRRSAFFFCHNLEYDLGVLFRNIILDTMNDVDLFESFDYKSFRFSFVYPKPVFMRIMDRRRGKYNSKRTFYFIDTIPFFRGSLEKMSEKLNLPVRKMRKPDYLGERKPKRDEMEYFKKYAMIDAEAVYYLGKEFMKFHEKYDVDPRTTVSPATLSAKTFRRKFLRNSIPLPKNKLLTYMSLQSYWGGRTEAFCGGRNDIKVYDYNSFYPYAMSKIFLPLDNDAWKFTQTFRSRFGFYRIKGEMPDMKVSPLPFRTERLIFPVGKFDVTVTGFEAENILKHAKDTKIMQGYYYDGDRDLSMRKYVKNFYREKEGIDRKKDPSGYTRVKLLLNSLYGKLIQVNQGQQYWYLMDIDEPYGHRYEAGGMFNPPIASWITGFCRSELFRVMNRHRDSVMYCDTDSIGILADDYGVKTDSRLGGLKKEGAGVGIIIREKNYIITGDIEKVARHGFWGTDHQFKDYIFNRRKNYMIKRLVKLKESMRTGKKPFDWEIQMRKLNLTTSLKRANPRTIDFLDDFVWLDPIKLKK